MKELELLIENFPDKSVLRRYKCYLENKDKSFTWIRNKYVKEIKKAIDNGEKWANPDEIEILSDTFRKSVRNIEEKGIESVFTRKDLVTFAMLINPRCIESKVNLHMVKEYIRRKFKLKLGKGKVGNYKDVFGERFGSEETFRKDLIKYLAECKNKIIDIKQLELSEESWIIDIYTRDDKRLCIDTYTYNENSIKSHLASIYESKYINSYLTKVEKGIISYDVLRVRSIISNHCRKSIIKLVQGYGDSKEYYLLVSPFSAGVINSFIYNKSDISFKLVDGELKYKNEEK